MHPSQEVVACAGGFFKSLLCSLYAGFKSLDGVGGHKLRSLAGFQTEILRVHCVICFRECRSAAGHSGVVQGLADDVSGTLIC